VTLRELRELLAVVGGELAAARELVLAGEGSDGVEVARTLAAIEAKLAEARVLVRLLERGPERPE